MITILKDLILMLLIVFVNLKVPSNLKKSRIISSAKVESCSKEEFFKITSMEVSPPEFIRGDSIITNVTGIALTNFTLFNKEALIKWNGNAWEYEVGLLSEKLEEQQTFQYNYTYSLPSYSPSGHWTIMVKIDDNIGNIISCTNTYFDLE